MRTAITKVSSDTDLPSMVGLLHTCAHARKLYLAVYEYGLALAGIRMLGCLSIKWRLRTASLLAVLYALCLGTPTVVMAFSQGAIPAHCLTNEHQDAGLVHMHHYGSTHRHTDGKVDDGDHESKCCGLFSVSAIAPVVDIVVAPLQPIVQQPSHISNDLNGRGSDRIDRPPRSHLSL